jgi:hypothetical protein
MVGRQGKVTGRVAPGLVGEVMVQVRGGAEAFLAYAIDPEADIKVGELVTVVEYYAPRTVYVARAYAAL